MGETASIIVGMTFVGLVLLITATLYESRQVRWAWEFLCRSDEDEFHDDQRATLLDRTRTALRALKLLRLLALLLTVPGLVLVAQFIPESYRLTARFESWQSLAGLTEAFGISLVLFIVVTCVHGIVLRGIRPSGEKFDANSIPVWLREENQPMPALLAAGALVWGWFHRRSDWVLHFPGIEKPRGQLYEADGEVRLAVGEMEMVALGEARTAARAHRGRDGHDERSELDMIRAIQRLDRTLVREVMRPLNNVTAVSLNNLTPEKFLALAKRTGYTRIPCYYDQITNLIGYLNVYEFLESPELPKDLRQLLHSAPFIPELAQVDTALQEMLRTRAQVAICFDEFGGCSGLLSREDIFEEITGEIMDEYDRPETKLIRTRGQFVIDGSLDLDDLAEQTGLELEKEGDTLAGFVYHRLSRVPRRGERIEEQGWTIEVAQMEGHRIRKLRLSPPASDDNHKEE